MKAKVIYMVLVDTSVIIDKIKKVENKKTVLFDRHLAAQKSFGISVFTFHEILQGAISDSEFKQLYKYFSTQKILTLPNTATAYAESAKLCFRMKNQGIVMSSTINILIAYTAIHYKIPLLHNDAEFDLIAEYNPRLRIMN